MNIVITGASRGIGRELIKRYLNRANKIYAIARDEEKLKELKKISNKIEIISLDLANLDKVREVSKYLGDKEIDLVILNAAISLPHSPNFTPFEDFKRSFDVNFLSIHALLEYIVPSMQKRKRGKIVFISSLASLIASPTSLPYSASKRALNSYAQSLRNLLAKDNIKVINILPGFIKTDMTAKNDFYMPFLMELEDGVDRIQKAIEKNYKEYAFPKRFYYLIKLFTFLPLNLQDKLLQNLVK
ncbi:SDR family NAD(P)-dependent oxidoreductase [Caminibacter mediatlanticus]|uniref:Short-chain dehydrogenase/reductase SDR n=1 Tax=Caminibacter mediatlanticus TB-2 TaxID=391592 RepID=A0AAI9AGQ8_9BACT|nr:SDR family NAD(P)-dependent oxidoreductase [Caminibacter mediatlanticus]EDM23876.1 Short-chain dehydrogenase/reductase SDR [Caminibacter mediatlanticus TB-2]